VLLEGKKHKRLAQPHYAMTFEMVPCFFTWIHLYIPICITVLYKNESLAGYKLQVVLIFSFAQAQNCMFSLHIFTFLPLLPKLTVTG